MHFTSSLAGAMYRNTFNSPHLLYLPDYLLLSFISAWGSHKITTCNDFQILFNFYSPKLNQPSLSLGEYLVPCGTRKKPTVQTTNCPMHLLYNISLIMFIVFHLAYACHLTKSHSHMTSSHSLHLYF